MIGDCDGGKDFDLVERALLEFAIFGEFLDRNDFDCKLPLFFGMVGFIYFAEGAWADTVPKDVVIDHFDHAYISKKDCLNQW